MAGQATPATTLLKRHKVNHRVHAYPHDPSAASYGTEAASALNIEPERCFKTLVVDIEGSLTVAIVPVSGSLDLKALAVAVGAKRATMADPTLAERTTGYVLGGISPLGQRKRLPTAIDTSATTFDTIYISAGRRGLEVELSPADLITLTNATVAAIASP